MVREVGEGHVVETHIIFQSFQVYFETNKREHSLIRVYLKGLQKPRKERFENEELVNRVKEQVKEIWELDLAIRRLLLTFLEAVLEELWRQMSNTVGRGVSGRWSSGGKAVRLALSLRKFGGKWSYKNTFLSLLVFAYILVDM